MIQAISELRLLHLVFPVGLRIIPAFSHLIGTVGLAYGMWSGYFDSSQLQLLTEHKVFLSTCIIRFLTSAGAGEIMVAVNTLKTYRKRLYLPQK